MKNNKRRLEFLERCQLPLYRSIVAFIVIVLGSSILYIWNDEEITWLISYIIIYIALIIITLIKCITIINEINEIKESIKKKKQKIQKKIY